MPIDASYQSVVAKEPNSRVGGAAWERVGRWPRTPRRNLGHCSTEMTPQLALFLIDQVDESWMINLDWLGNSFMIQIDSVLIVFLIFIEDFNSFGLGMAAPSSKTQKNPPHWTTGRGPPSTDHDASVKVAGLWILLWDNHGFFLHDFALTPQ